MNFQRRCVWEKVISYEEAHEDEIVDNPLKVELEILGGIGYLQVEVQVFPQNPYMKKLKQNMFNKRNDETISTHYTSMD